MDFYSTFLDLAGIPAPTDRVVDGISLKDALLNEKNTDRLEQWILRGNLQII